MEGDGKPSEITRAAEIILDRALGKARQEVEVSVDRPIVIPQALADLANADPNT